MGLTVLVDGRRALRLERRIQSVTVTDMEGDEADGASIAAVHDGVDVPDIDARIGLFSDGERLGSSDFIVSMLNWSARSGMTAIRCLPYDATGALKAPTSKSFAGQNLGAIVQSIAKEFGLRPAVARALESLVPGGAVQENESPLAFLSRLAKRQNAKLSVKDGRIILSTRDGKSASGLDLPAMRIDAGNPDVWLSWKKRKKSSYGTVKAKYVDEDGITVKSVSAGEGEPELLMPQIFSGKEEARSAAEGKLKDLGESADEIGIELPLTPRARAAGKVSVANGPAGGSGEWKITEVLHEVRAGSAGQTTIRAVAG